jgi:N6-adenosine-specific RNA methylase IME4
MQSEALAVAKAWGFTVTSEIIWVKSHGSVSGPGNGTQMGMGRTVRNCHEVCLVARRGKPARASASVRSVIVAPRGEHSAKPDEFYRTVDRLVGSGARVVELFARRQWPVWTCLGDEISGAEA